ncbi:phenylacetate-CoA oxygenase subunit PaaI [Chitinophagaceae bacterium IBVUCB1]|nr:phenylacetate-CoA oxygenase subunit PaaI [Chitinophagaceae bacterium IBVUCB1]
MTNQPVNQSTNRLLYTLQIADNALILGHRISEWCGHGPILEQDIALTNTALDHLGQARSLYQHAADMFNALPADEQKTLFSSTALQNKITKGENIDEDDLAYLRDGWDFRNALLAEQPNKDWAYTVVRSFLYDTFNFYFYAALQNSKDVVLAAVAEKSLKEVTYHLRWSSEWMIRLGDGTDESKARVQEALDSYWAYTGELFETTVVDKTALADGIGVDIAAIKTQWQQRVNTVLEEATLTLPTNTWMHSGGKECRHSEHLGYILAEMQFMQRAYPDMEW